MQNVDNLQPDKELAPQRIVPMKSFTAHATRTLTETVTMLCHARRNHLCCPSNSSSSSREEGCTKSVTVSSRRVRLVHGQTNCHNTWLASFFRRNAYTTVSWIGSRSEQGSRPLKKRTMQIAVSNIKSKRTNKSVQNQDA